MRHSVVFGCLVILLFAGVALCSLKPDTLKRTSSLPLIDKKEKAPPPLRRTKSSPAILSRSVLVNKKVTAAPSKKFKGKKTVTITGKLVWKKSLKKKTVFLQLASQTRSHTNALILRKKKKVWPFFVIAGGIMLFHAFTRKPVERKPKAFLSSVKDSVSDWKPEEVYTVKKDGATIKILKSNNKEFEIVADSPQRLKEVGKELEQVKEQVYKDIEKMETFKKAKKEMSKEVKENPKKDVALEMARLLDKYPRPPNDNDPFDAISTEDILLGLRYLSTVSEHVKDAFRQLDNEVKSRLSEMPEWQQRLYQMEDPLGGASFEDILDTTLKVTKTGKKVAKAMKETEEYFSPITETFEAGLESIDSLGKVIQSVEETMKEKTKDYDGKPLYFALADLNDYGMDWRDMRDTYGGGDDNGGGFDNNDDSTTYSPPEDDKGTISNEKIEVDNVDDGGAAAMEQIFDDSDKSNPFLN